MRIQQINRSDAEKVFGVYKNATAATLAADSVVQLVAGASADGNSITTPTTNFLDLVIGLVDTAITTLDFGNVQLYGFRSSAPLYIGASVTPAGGDKLVPVAGQTYLQYVAAGDGRDGHFAAIGTTATSTATQKVSVSIFIRAM